MSSQRGSATLFDQLSLAIGGDGKRLKDRGEYIAFPRDAEAEVIADHLLTLPVETRRTLYRILHENGDTFTGSSQPKRIKKHPWPPRSR